MKTRVRSIALVSLALLACALLCAQASSAAPASAPAGSPAATPAASGRPSAARPLPTATLSVVATDPDGVQLGTASVSFSVVASTNFVAFRTGERKLKVQVRDDTGARGQLKLKVEAMRGLLDLPRKR